MCNKHEVPHLSFKPDTFPPITVFFFSVIGVHYWYDISPDMHCDQVFPVFLMYGQSSGRLKAFGWSVLANIQSYLWEHPPMKYFKVMINLKQGVRISRSTIWC